jgi:hypothetical protein
MLSSIRRRLTRVEEFLPLPLTAERFYARARQYAKHKGVSIGDAMTKLLKDVSDGELESLEAEFEQMAFGSDTAARDAAKRAFFAEAGYPDWTSPPVEESRGEGW